MAQMRFREAIRQAVREEMTKDDSVFVIGEDMRRLGGGFSVLAGLWDEFGDARVIDTPISESLIAGAAAGAAVMGMKPVAEVMFADFLTISMDQIVNYAAKVRYMHAGQLGCPVVIRAPIGAGVHYGMWHEQSPEAWFIHVPGLKVLVPATPYDAKGMMKAAIEEPDPVLFFEHKLLYNEKGEVPAGEYTVAPGKAQVKRVGDDVTVIAYGVMVGQALEAAEELKEEEISVEVLDLRSLSPLDVQAIAGSVEKTGRVIITHEGCQTGGVGAEVAAVVGKEAFWSLEAPIVRVASPDIPVPFVPIMEDFYIPSAADIVAAVKQLIVRT